MNLLQNGCSNFLCAYASLFTFFFSVVDLWMNTLTTLNYLGSSIIQSSLNMFREDVLCIYKMTKMLAHISFVVNWFSRSINGNVLIRLVCSMDYRIRMLPKIIWTRHAKLATRMPMWKMWIGLINFFWYRHPCFLPFYFFLNFFTSIGSIPCFKEYSPNAIL